MTVRLSSNLVYYSQGRESYFAKSLLSVVTAGRHTRAGMGTNTAAKCWGEQSNGGMERNIVKMEDARFHWNGDEDSVCSSVRSGGGPSVSRSSSSPSSSLWGGVDGGGARLLPPLLPQQSWGVHSQQAFLLYCLALGPTDLSIHWHSNGRRLDTVNEYRHTFSHDAVLVSSWVREQPLSKDAHYQCIAVSESGNDTSKIDLRLSSRDEANTFSEELNQWREALADHERQLQNWKKAWESCDGQGVL
ncbi:hypothetical protein MHYP_G00207690 [Metynnis hypsauchen]